MGTSSRDTFNAAETSRRLTLPWVLLIVFLHTASSIAEPLSVTTISPQGKVPRGARQLVIAFSEPMVALGTADAPNPPAILIPQPEGRWRWIDTKTLAFEPPALLPQATLYTVKVPAGAKSWSGSVLPETVVSRFETPPPVLLDPHPGARMKDNTPGGRKALSLAFNQRVDKAQLTEQVRLVGGGREYRMVPPPARRGSPEREDLAWLQPAQPLPALTDFKLILPAGLRSLEGPLTSKHQEVTFRTPPPLLLNPGEVLPGRITIRASNSLEHDNTGQLSEPSAVTVEPPVPNLEMTSWDDLHLEGSFIAGETYRVTISTSLRDEFGQSLDSSQSWALTVPEGKPRRLEPALWLKHIGSDLILDPRKPRLTVRTQDLRQFEVELRRVKLEDRKSWKAGDRQLGRLVESRIVKTGGLGLQTTEVDLSPALEHGVGHVLVRIKMLPDAGVDLGLQPAEWNQWVQVTRLGVTAVELDDMWAVWVASSDTGQPLPLAQVVAQSKVIQVTDASGYAEGIRLPQDHEMLVRLGHDSTYFPLRSLPQPGLDFYFAEPQGVYRPGETFRLRGLSNPTNSIVSRSTQEVTVLGYKIDSTEARGTVNWGPLGEFDIEFKLPENLSPGPAYLRLSRDYDLDAANYPISISLPRMPHFSARFGTWLIRSA